MQTAGFQHGPVAGGACHVCGQSLDSAGTALCNACDRPFHLRASEIAEGRDCGQVWMNDQYLTLEFACDVCLGRGAEEPPVGRGH